MADLLKLGVSSLLNVQQALTTTGHNISNANTVGYSRQSVNFATREAQSLGSGYLGQGAFISGIERSSSSFLTGQVQNYTASQARHQTYVNYSARLDDLLADANNSLSSSLQEFFGGVQDMASNPSSLPERQALLADAGNLVNRLQNLNQRMETMNREVNAELSSVVNEVNGYSKAIRQLNIEIVSASASNAGQPPNDLLDQRDLLITQLASKVGVSVLPQADGSVSVFAGKGQPLVVGNEVTLLETRPNPYDASKLEVAFSGKSGNAIISPFLEGGHLKGLLDFRDKNMESVQSRIGLLALSLGAEFNALHQEGADLNSQMGGLFFSEPDIRIAAHVSNTGVIKPKLTLDDATQVRASEYRLQYDGSAWHLTRESDGTQAVDLGGGVLELDGMRVDTSLCIPGLADSYTFNPARDAADTFQVAIKDPHKIAAAAAVKNVQATSNTGNATLGTLQVTDSAAMPLTTPITVRYDADALGAGLPGFVLSGGATGTIAYDPASESNGKDFELSAQGISFRINGTPANGDTFTLSDNRSARGDNRNALALAGLQLSPIVNGGKDTLQTFYGALVADVGINQREAQSNLKVEDTLLEQATAYRDNLSGVNLDEEAANILRFQQAYQAAAQMIKVADEVFRSLLQSLG
jgi:flagellar hook-associated protein 1 FlgK